MNSNVNNPFFFSKRVKNRQARLLLLLSFVLSFSIVIMSSCGSNDTYLVSDPDNTHAETSSMESSYDSRSIPTEPYSATEIEGTIENSKETDTESTEEKTTAADTTELTQKSLTVRFLDVGQGDSILVMSQGHVLLIDGGPSNRSDKIYAVLEELQCTYIDCLIASHDDSDHVGGLSGALQIADVAKVYCNVTHSTNDAFTVFTEKLEKKGIQITSPEDKEVFELGDAVVTIYSIGSAISSENESLVVRIECGNYSFLLTGDSEAEEEQYLVETYKNELQSTVLKMGHHGSKNSSSNAFVNTVLPEYAIISVGKDNSYGHPNEEAIMNVQSVGAIVYRTDLQGDIFFSVLGESFAVTSERNIDMSQEEICRASTSALEESSSEVETTDTAASVVERTVPEEAEKEYIANTNTHVFHKTSCSSVKKMSEKNKWGVTCTRQHLIDLGYKPCQICNP